jgi:hypothetical protein
VKLDCISLGISAFFILGVMQACNSENADLAWSNASVDKLVFSSIDQGRPAGRDRIRVQRMSSDIAAGLPARGSCAYGCSAFAADPGFCRGAFA